MAAAFTFSTTTSGMGMEATEAKMGMTLDDIIKDKQKEAKEKRSARKKPTTAKDVKTKTGAKVRERMWTKREGRGARAQILTCGFALSLARSLVLSERDVSIHTIEIAEREREREREYRIFVFTCAVCVRERGRDEMRCDV